MKALLLDVETTGLNPETDHIIEIGCVLYSVPHRTVLATFSSLVDPGSGNPIEHVNRISSAALADEFVPASIPKGVRSLINSADVIVAHRAEFDRSFVMAADAELATLKPWCCSKFDIEFPNSSPGASLVEVALAHGVPVWQNHRALTDCMLLAHVFDRVPDMQARIERAMLPRVLVQALVSYDDREQAKQAGFNWESNTKRWIKRVIKNEPQNFSFKTKEIET